jgi:hypothetical protein
MKNAIKETLSTMDTFLKLVEITMLKLNEKVL